MAHFPVNHHLRPLYRTLAGLAGLYVLLFGIVGLVKTRGTATFAQRGEWVLGLRANPAFAVLSIVAGLVIVVASLIGRNLDRYVYLGAGVLFMAAGMGMMVLLQTNANFLGFSMTTCIVSFVLGIICLTAGLYTKVGSQEQARAEDEFRHRSASARPPAERHAS